VLDVASLFAVCGDEQSSVVDVASVCCGCLTVAVVCVDEQSSVFNVASLFAVMCVDEHGCCLSVCCGGR